MEVPTPLSNGKTTKIIDFHTTLVCIFIATSCSVEGQEYTECGTACPVTCQNLNPAPCAPDCVPGCQCPLGTVLDEQNNKCVDHCTIPPCQRGK